MSWAADQTRTIVNNCAVASWLLSTFNRKLHVYSVRSLRRAAFWELYNNDGDLKDVSGVQRSTFLKLLRDLKPRLLPTEASQYGRPKHALELQVACGLHYLARGTTYSTCMGVFGIGKLTALKYVKTFVIAVNVSTRHQDANQRHAGHNGPENYGLISTVQGSGWNSSGFWRSRRHAYFMPCSNRHHTYSVLMQGLVDPDW